MSVTAKAIILAFVLCATLDQGTEVALSAWMKVVRHKIVVFVAGVKEINVFRAFKTCSTSELVILKNDFKTAGGLWEW